MKEQDIEKTSANPITEDDIREQITEVGAVVKIKWTADELPRWYIAHVQAYNEEEDLLDVICTLVSLGIQLTEYMDETKLNYTKL